jgi:hypothetical protein
MNPNSHNSTKFKTKRSYLITEHNIPSKGHIVGNTSQPGPEWGPSETPAKKPFRELPESSDSQPLEDFKWLGWVEKARDYDLYPHLANR